MEAKSVDEIPTADAWQYEPKWDGFRCIAFRDSEKIYLQSKAGQPLARYFPDIVDALAKVPARSFVVDGELAVPIQGRLSFDELGRAVVSRPDHQGADVHSRASRTIGSLRSAAVFGARR